jgi:hypothetical protein
MLRFSYSNIRSLILTSLLMTLLLNGCSSTNSQSSSESVSSDSVIFQSLPAGALPPGSKLLTEQTLVLGSGENWVGRVNLDIGKDSETAYRYFVQEYPKQGWSLLSSNRGQVSLLIFMKDSRTASIQITENTVLLPGKAVITVSPRNTASSPNSK